jgi:isocitrate lyase
MTDEQRAASPEVDYRPFLVADADAGHGGEAHVRSVVRRFVEAGVPALHIEDQEPGAKRGGQRGGKVLAAQDEQLKRLVAARFQLDVMGVPGILVSRTDAGSATLLDGRSDERDQPFILGATNVNLPSFKAVSLALSRELHRRGIDELRGHQLYATSDDELDAAASWLEPPVTCGKNWVRKICLNTCCAHS